MEHLAGVIVPAFLSPETALRIRGNAKEWTWTTLLILRDHYEACRDTDLLESGQGDWEAPFEVANKWASRNLGCRLQDTTVLQARTWLEEQLRAQKPEPVIGPSRVRPPADSARSATVPAPLEDNRAKDLQVDAFLDAKWKHGEALLWAATVRSPVERLILSFGLNNRCQRAKATPIIKLKAATSTRLPGSRIVVSENTYLPWRETRQGIIQLLEINLLRNNFQFNGEWFLQVKGTAMGKRFAPAYVNIFMAEWEESALNPCDKRPLHHYRYLDDIWGVWSHSEEEFNRFLHTLNTHNASIKLKSSTSLTAVDFLDTTTFKGPDFNNTG
ncbi:hypothetical protein CCH79_00015971 [Gambusia affinis]|uniref:Reverse transcriptase domain-containing protein n=1 Tax=Gambusia affinis TaxID=33528 RepID=A0A315VXQ5_GAMAF|nr:hypothetical protein CCH79_00015971 [Gambusia affinis]